MERYWDMKSKIERLSFPKRWKFQMDLLAGRSVLSVIAICMVMMMSSCSKNGVYFYFDDVVKHEDMLYWKSINAKDCYEREDKKKGSK